MKFTETFPLMYCLNLAKRQDRRVRCEEVFEDYALPVRRFPAVNAAFVKNRRGFESAGRYSHAVSTRMIVRRAMLQKAPAVFIFEDDVVLADDLHERLADIELPDDWGIFYLGCQHQQRPQVVADGLVQVAGALDTHAWGVRASHYRQVMRALDGREDPPTGSFPPADVFLAKLHPRVPSYAAYPNLAWQEEEHSDLVRGVFSNYRTDGTQKTVNHRLEGLTAEALGGKAWKGCDKTRVTPFYEPRWFGTEGEEEVVPVKARLSSPISGNSSKVAFLFLTREGLPHSALWEDYWKGEDDRYSVYSHSSKPTQIDDGWFRQALISKTLATGWGDISLVRAQLDLLRTALEDSANGHFIFLSESCVPIRPFSELKQCLELDPRSRFILQTPEEVIDRLPEKAGRAKAMERIPTSFFRLNPMWVSLSREAAELLVEDDFTSLFDGVHCPDECYFGTVLHLKGYPLTERVVPMNTTHTRWLEDGGLHPVTFAEVKGCDAARFKESGAFFARKFTARSNIAKYALHLPLTEQRRSATTAVAPSAIVETAVPNFLVLCGQHRGGSTLLQRIFNEHSGVQIRGENYAAFEHLSKFVSCVEKLSSGDDYEKMMANGTFPAWFNRFDPEALRAQLEGALESLVSTDTHASLIGYKEIRHGVPGSTSLKKFANNMSRLLGDRLRIVFLTREIDALISSIKRVYWVKNLDESLERKRLAEQQNAFSSYAEMRPEIARAITYDEVVGEPDAVREIVEFCGVRFDPDAYRRAVAVKISE